MSLGRLGTPTTWSFRACRAVSSMAPPSLRRPYDRRTLTHWYFRHGKWSSSLDVSVQVANSKLDVIYGAAPVLELRPRAPPYHSPTGSSPSSSTCGNRCADQTRSSRRLLAPAVPSPLSSMPAAMEAVDPSDAKARWHWLLRVS